MGNTIAAFVAVMTVAALDQGEVARYDFVAAWPTKVSIASLDVDSSAPGVLASGSYRLELVVQNQRLIGRMQRGSDVVETIPFSIEGCERVKTPTWARRATARGLPPAAGQNDRRVELKIADTSTRGCAITGVFTPAAGFTARPDQVPGGPPDSGIPDTRLVVPTALADLRIRAARPDPDDPKMIQVQVHNAGPGKTIATEVKLFYTKNGKVTTGQAPVPALAPNTSVWVTVGVSARVDDPNKVSETNELNNSYKFK
jgi:hypothetical protein